MGKRKPIVRNMSNSQANNVFTKKCKVGAIYKNSFAQSEDIDNHQALEYLKEMFKDKIEEDVIEGVFNDLKKDVEQALEVLLKLGEEKETPNKHHHSELGAFGSENHLASSSSLFKAQANLIPFQNPDIANKIENILNRNEKLLIIMRGLPGSGKSTLAQQLWKSGGIILSTDDFFMRSGSYQFDPDLLHEAHSWNRQRAIQAMKDQLSPVIIDNTNIEEWEIKPYVIIGLHFKYHMLLVEPDTPWKFNVNYLAKNNTHKVSKQKLKQMLERYNKNLSLDHIIEKVQSISSLNTFADNKFISCKNKSKSANNTFSFINKTSLEDNVTCNKALPANHQTNSREKSKSLEMLDSSDMSIKESPKEISKSINSLFELFGIDLNHSDNDPNKQEGKTHIDSSSPEIDSLSLLSSHSSSQGWEAVTDEFTWEVKYNHPQHHLNSNWDPWDQPVFEVKEKGPKPPRISKKASYGIKAHSADEIETANSSPSHSVDDIDLVSLDASSKKSSHYLVNDFSQTSSFYFDPTNAHCLDSSVIILEPKKYCPSPFSIEVAPKEGTCDKSTLTDEIINDTTYDEKFNKLQTEFPHIGKEEISHILKLCKHDFIWAKNIINDSSHLENALFDKMKSDEGSDLIEQRSYKVFPENFSLLPIPSPNQNQSTSNSDMSDKEDCQNESQNLSSFSSTTLIPLAYSSSSQREKDNYFSSPKLSSNGSLMPSKSNQSFHNCVDLESAFSDFKNNDSSLADSIEEEDEKHNITLEKLKSLFSTNSFSKISKAFKQCSHDCEKLNEILENLSQYDDKYHYDKLSKEEMLMRANNYFEKNSFTCDPFHSQNSHLLGKDPCICDMLSLLLKSLKLDENLSASKSCQTESQYLTHPYATESFDSSTKILMPRPYNKSPLTPLPKLYDSKINRGILTEEAKLSYLQILFPHFSLEEILHIYKVCNHNITWVTNILFDSLKNNKLIIKEFYKNYRRPRKLLPFRATNHDRTVKKILDIFNIDINFTSIEEVLLAQSNKNRSQQKKTLIRNQSLSDLISTLEIDFNKDEETLTTDSSTEAGPSVHLVREVFNFNSEYFDDCCHNENDNNSLDDGDFERLKDQPDFLNSPLLITESPPGSPLLRESPLNEKSCYQLSLSPLLAKELINNFGFPLSSISPDNLSPEDLIVDLDDFGMELLYSLWSASLKKRAFPEPCSSSTRKYDPSPASSFPSSMQSLSQEAYHFPPSNPKDTESFQEIMDMELAKELDREQRVAARRQQMVAWGTWHNQREELYQQFPGVDKDVLDELYDSTGGDLKKCTKLLDDPIHCQSLFSSSSTMASYLQGDATYHFIKKQERHKKAEQFFSQGLNNIAFYNSQLSQFHHKKLKELSQNQEDYSHLLLSPVTLDLHGLFVPEAIRTLRAFLHDKQNELMRSSYKKLMVFAVTGIGRHSVGRPKLLPAVVNFLTSNKFNFEEDKPGVLRIAIKRTHT